VKCPFCERDVERFKTNSHIVPKWMHKPTFEGNKGFVSINLKKQKAKIVQDGLKSSFVCDACEDLFEKDDTYASKVFVDRGKEKGIKNISSAERRILGTANAPVPCLVLTGIKFKKVQKFILGVFIRAYLSGIHGSKPVLGEKHFKNVRKMYLDESDINDIAYPILILKIDSKDMLRNVVHFPARGKDYTSGVNLVAFTGGEFEFLMIVQSHKVPSEVMMWRLTNDGTLIMPIVRPSMRPGALEHIKQTKVIARKQWKGPPGK